MLEQLSQPEERDEEKVAAASADSAESLELFRIAAAAVVNSSGGEQSCDLLKRATERIAKERLGGSRVFNERRAKQLQSLGGYNQRFVLLKDFDNEGRLIPRSPPRPARDNVRSHMAQLANTHPHIFPDGLDRFMEVERPLVRVGSVEFARVIAASVRAESNALSLANRPTLLAKLVDMIEQLLTYRQLMELVSDAHPTAIEHIDQSDTAGMMEFLIGIGKRTPMSDAEFQRFVELSRVGWDKCREEDVVLRGRILNTAVGGKLALLQKWATPFVRYLFAHGQIPELLRKYEALAIVAKRAPSLRIDAAESAPRSTIHATPATECLSDSGQFIIPLNTPEPHKLLVLRNYLRCSSMSHTVALDNALQIAGAVPTFLVTGYTYSACSRRKVG